MPTSGRDQAAKGGARAAGSTQCIEFAGVVSAQNWLTGERLCGGDANALAEELEPMWLNALLLRVPEAFGYYAIPVCTRPEAEFGLGVRWSLALTS